jgi:hypothetical protein
MANGLFAELGMDFDPDAELRSQQEAANRRSLGLVHDRFRNPGVQGAANIGALLGAKVAGVPGLTPQQQQAETIKQETKAGIDKWLEVNPGASEVDKAAQFEQQLASSAFKNGRGDLAAPLLQKIDADKKAREQQRLNLELLGIRRDTERLQYDRLKTPYKRDSIETIYKYGEKDPMKGTTAYIAEDGTAELADGTKIPLGEYTMDRPLDPSRGGYGAGNINKSDVAGLQERLTGLFSRGKTIGEVWDVTKEAYAAGLGAAPTGRAGDFASWVDRGVNDLSNLFTVMGNGPTTSVGPDGKSIGLETSSGRKKYADSNRSFVEQYLPANLPKTAQLNERYSALVTNLAWASALSKQPGRAISDADMKMEMQLVAKGLNNPQTVKQILLGGYSRALEDMNFRLAMLAPEDRYRVDPNNTLTQIRQVHAELMSDMDAPLPGTNPLSFATEEEAEEAAAKNMWKPGTKITIGGRNAVWNP